MHWFILFLVVVGIGTIDLGMVTGGLLTLLLALVLYACDEGFKYFKAGETE